MADNYKSLFQDNSAEELPPAPFLLTDVQPRTARSPATEEPLLDDCCAAATKTDCEITEEMTRLFGESDNPIEPGIIHNR